MSQAVPRSCEEWHDYVRAHDLHGVSLHDGQHKDSGSEMGLDQFLLLRVIYARPKAISANRLTSRDLHDYVSHKVYEEAKRFLWPGSRSFEAYLSSFERTPQQLRVPPFPDLGTFSLPRLYQIDVLDTSQHKNSTPTPKIAYSPPHTRSRTKTPRDLPSPTKRGPTPTPASKAPSLPFGSPPMGPDPGTPRTPINNPWLGDEADDQALSDMTQKLFIASPMSPGSSDFQVTPQAARDEQLVNVALIAFLGASTLHSPVKGYWSMHRKSFFLTDQANRASPQQKGTKVYRADVDGYLRFQNSEEAKAIVEVKPFPRTNSSVTAIRIQESAQMAAWVNESPPQGLGRNERATRLLISQDRDEIYLTFASFTGEYVSFIRNDSPPKKAPLELARSGDGRARTRSHTGSAELEIGSDEPPPEGSFMTMREYGPFSTSVESHMRSLGVFVLAFSLQACNYE